MIECKVKIRGVKPILFHKFNIESISEMSKVKSGTAGNNPDEWRNSFFEEGGQIYMPGGYITSALKNGSVHTKQGRGSIQKSWISAIQVQEEKVYLNRKMPENWQELSTDDFPKDPSNEVYLDIRMVANPNTKGRNVRYRIACSIGWECEFTLLVNDKILSKEIVKKVVEDTGVLQGIADARTLGYGRFTVLECEFLK